MQTAHSTAHSTEAVMAVFEGILRRSTFGDLEHVPCGDTGLTLLQGTANELFRDPTYSRRTMAEYDYNQSVQVTLGIADMLNKKRRGLLDPLADDANGVSPGPGWRNFRRDYPWSFEKLDAEQFGPWVYIPLNRDLNQLRSDHPPGGSHEAFAWYFRSDPLDIEGAWSSTPGQMYDENDLRRPKIEFRPLYHERLRRLLAEATPGLGALGRWPR
jgi:hypothetical protein